MTSNKNRAPLPCVIKLCAWFKIHQWIQIGVTVRNAQFGSKLVIILSGWLDWICLTTTHVLQDKLAVLYFVPCDLEIWWMTSKNYRAPLPYYIQLCALFQINRWIQIGVTLCYNSHIIALPSTRTNTRPLFSTRTLTYIPTPTATCRQGIICRYHILRTIC